MKLREALKGKIPGKEMAFVPRAFDIVGDVAIIEIPGDLSKRKRKIAEALKETHPRVKTVCNKKGERSGEYRLSELEVILGKDTETVHMEHGCRFRVDVRRAYFSAREAAERQRIAKMIKPGENVLVMFSGVCPSPIIYAKAQPKMGKVYGVDVNPDAHGYAVENVRINRLQTKVVPLCGDVRKVVPGIGRKFDRIAMPLPKGAQDFLDVALGAVKDGGIIHFYYWDREDHLYSGALGIIEREAKKAGRKVKIVGKHKVLPYGPKVWKICVEFSVSGVR
jgi:tRNA (guanine37-N1)-methyltransferase